MEVKRVPDEKQARATETLETLMASKKKIQCRAMSIPTLKNCHQVFCDIFKSVRLIFNSIKIPAVAISILYHASDIAGREMSFPKIPVNPRMKTMKCRRRKFLLKSGLFMFIR